MKNKMDVKKALVSFLAITTVLLLAGIISASYIVTGSLADITEVEVDGISMSPASPGNVSVVSGDSISIKVVFTSLADATDVRAKVVLEGEKQDAVAQTVYFDVEANKVYSKTITLRVPEELTDEISDDLNLEVKIWNSDMKSEIKDLVLRVQRPSYNVEVVSISTSNKVEAGELFPVDIVVKNLGYNDLEDLYVTAKISDLNAEKTLYFGDLVSVEDSDDEADTISGRLYLRIPYESSKSL